MKYFYNQKHVKTLPKKYEVLGDLSVYFSDFSKKRLTHDEKNLLNKALAWHKVKEELKGTREGRLTLEFFKEELPVKAMRVVLRDKKHYYVLATLSKKEVKVAESVYNLFPDQQTIYRNF
jgi:hypothetical protein